MKQMGYKSLAQERYFHANKNKLEKNGVNIAEWDKLSKGKKLPEHAVLKRPLSLKEKKKQALRKILLKK
jgi:hypothetical protein